MKRLLLSLAIILTAGISAQAQNQKECCKKECCKAEKKGKVTVVKIEDNNIFSQCFKDMDANGDGIVDCCEAKKATFLSLERGGRSNVITNYDFLKYFPNLEALSVGNTTLEEIDMHYMTKLKVVNVTNALWLKKIIVGGEVGPDVTGEVFDENNINKESVKVEFWVEDPVARQLFKDGYQYVEPVKQDGETFYIVSKNTDDYSMAGDFGLWHNGKLEVPCKYGYEDLKKNYFTVEVKELGNGDNQLEHPADCRCQLHQNKELQMMTELLPTPNLNVVTFKDSGIRDFCTDWLKTVDTDKDKIVTLEEAAAVKELCLMNFKSFMRIIKDYDDLKYFPNLECLHAGTSYAETVDLSACKKLKEVDLSDCRMLKKIILAKGCKPQIKYPVAYKGDKAKIIYK